MRRRVCGALSRCVVAQLGRRVSSTLIPSLTRPSVRCFFSSSSSSSSDFFTQHRNGIDVLIERGFMSESTDLARLKAWFDRDGADSGDTESPSTSSSSSSSSSPCRQRTVYAGFDPTADSLHMGNFVVVMALAHLQRAGNRVVLLVGGATGLVGDPSGRDTERAMLSEADVARNLAGIRDGLVRVFDFDETAGVPPRTLVVDNADWYRDMTSIDFLRDVGRHFRMSAMLNKESVASRLSRDDGMSFTEFAYQTLQSHDFFHLNERYGCSLQVGGSDQWGNITAGIEYARRRTNGDATMHGMTVPLLTNAAGEKFGKSAGNAVWLNANRTSPYTLYQYLLNSDDADVARFLKVFTFLSIDEIDAIVTEHERDCGRRHGQRALAAEVTRLLHGEAALEEAVIASDALFASSSSATSEYDMLCSLRAADIRSTTHPLFEGVPQTTLPRSAFGDVNAAATSPVGVSIVELVVMVQAAKSKNAARKLVTAGGVYVNGDKIADVQFRVTREHLLDDGQFCVLRAGKKRQFVVLVEEEQEEPSR